MPPVFLLKYALSFRRFKTIASLRRVLDDRRPSAPTGHESYGSIFPRLSDAYRRAKEHQDTIPEPYRVGPLWQSVVDQRCGDLAAALQDRDHVRLRALLENFHREKFTVGSGEASGDYYRMKANPLYKYQFACTWHEYYRIYEELAGDGSHLTYPLLGNPVGLSHHGQVIPIEAVRYHYYATEILSLLTDVEQPTVCEIGGGLGGQAYKTLSDSMRPMTYVLLDIPEGLVVASYFLMTALPEKTFLLYGEGPLDAHALKEYDVILMPNFALPQLGGDAVDLFFNSSSFSEMNRVTVEEYLLQIQRICRRYFMHINHTARFTWSDHCGESTNLPANEIELDPRRFKRIYQHRRPFARAEDRMFYRYHKAGHFAFRHERTTLGQ